MEMDTPYSALKDTSKVELCVTQSAAMKLKDTDQFAGDLVQKALSSVELSVSTRVSHAVTSMLLAV